MNNKETLQNHNTILNTNNDKLLEILQTINELPKANNEGNNEKLIEKDINFFDYDGTLLHSYTLEEVQTLSSLPQLPEHEGLICQGWNWDLNDIKSVNQELDIGPMYITDDGKTRLYIEIEQPSGLNVTLSFYQSVANGVTIDWGDGTNLSSPSAGNVNQSHQYASGKYIITLDIVDGCTFYFGRNIKDNVNYVSVLFGNDTSYTYPMAILKHVELGKNVQLNKGALASCYGLETITIPESITLIGLYTLYRNYALKFISFPKNINLESSQWMQDAYSLEIMSLPKNITLSENLTISGMRSLKRIPYLSDNVNKIPNYCFQTSYSFKKVVFSNVRSVGDSAFNWCQNLSILDFRRCTQVPTLGNTPFYRGPISFKILVPSALYDQWIAASGWSSYKDYIEAV